MSQVQINSSSSPNRASVLYSKAFWRIVPLLMACYTVSYLNRINIGFAKLQMSSTLGLSESVFGIGAGVFFIGYFIFGLPSNLLMQRFGARRWIGCLMIVWGIWWTWDARLTSALVCWLLYAGYLMLRRAIEEPTARARISAVFNIFAFADVPIVIFSIKWWRTQHPQPVFWGGGSIDPAMYLTAVLNLVALILLAVVLALIRLRQEEVQREIDSLRRYAHAV